MNIERIRELADHVEKLKHVPYIKRAGGPGQFNMRGYTFSCGTPACIAGHAVALFGGDPDLSIGEAAANALGINYEEDFHPLFEPPYPNLFPWSKITPAQAARCLRHLADTGDVDWDLAVETEDA